MPQNLDVLFHQALSLQEYVNPTLEYGYTYILVRLQLQQE